MPHNSTSSYHNLLSIIPNLIKWEKQRKEPKPSDCGSGACCHFQCSNIEKSDSVEFEGDWLCTIYQMLPGGMRERGWSSSRYICETAFAFSTMSKGSLIKGRNG